MLALIIGGTVVTLAVALTTYRESGPSAAFAAGRRTFGRGLLAGLEVFVAADLIRTVSVDLTLQAVGALGLLVVIRHDPELLDRRRDQRGAAVAQPTGGAGRRLTSSSGFIRSR